MHAVIYTSRVEDAPVASALGSKSVTVSARYEDGRDLVLLAGLYVDMDDVLRELRKLIGEEIDVSDE